MKKQRSIYATVSCFGRDNPVSQLNDYIRRFSEPSFDRWNDEIFLSVCGVTITRPFVESLIEFLNLPFAKDPAGTTDKEKKWIRLEFHDQCRFDQDCTLDDMRRLFFTIAHRAEEVWIDDSGDVLSRFLSIRHLDDQLEVSRLHIDHYDLSVEQFAQLGDVIRRSIHLKILGLNLRFLDGAHEVFAPLANAIELRKLTIWNDRTSIRQRKDLGDLVAGKNGDGPVIRFLRNPHNQLRELTLRDIYLKDHHLIAILQSIPSKQIEYLDFASNLIQISGMLEFCNLLPKMKSLKTVHFERNSWEDLPADDRTTIGAALVQGMMENMSIEYMYDIEAILDNRLLLHYIALNRAGRRIVQLSQPIPHGWWPLILAGVGADLIFKCEKYDARADVIYYFLPCVLSLR